MARKAKETKIETTTPDTTPDNKSEQKAFLFKKTYIGKSGFFYSGKSYILTEEQSKLFQDDLC
jgi:hypothetical protein